MTDYKLMPKQITKEMAEAFWEEYSKDRADDLLMRCYRAMYAVAPQPADQQPVSQDWDNQQAILNLSEAARSLGVAQAKDDQDAINYWSAEVARFEREARQPAPDVSDYEQVLDDHRRLTRELDVLLNSEEGAAQQASLADLVAQLRTESKRSQAMTTPKHPIQPIVADNRGRLRFKENRIVSDLLDFASDRGFDLNEIARRNYSREDRQQLAQLIGYSLDGYGELRNYVDDVAYGAAQLMASGLSEAEARIEHLQSTLNALRAALVEPMSKLFEVHPDDLFANLPETSHDNQ